MEHPTDRAFPWFAPRDGRVVVDAHNWASKAFLRILVLLAPLWFLACGVMTFGLIGTAYYATQGGYLVNTPPPASSDPFDIIFQFFFQLTVFFQSYFHYTWNYIPLGILCPAAFILGACSLKVLLTNKLVIKNDTIMFPPLDGRSSPLSDLLSVSNLERERTGKWWDAAWLNFLLESIGANRQIVFALKEQKPVKIGAWRLGGRKINQLAGALESRAPHCALKLAAPLKTAPPLNDETVAEISYKAHSKLFAFIKLLKSYEKYFWRVYVSLCLIPVLAAFPYVLYWIPHWVSRTHPSGAEPVWLMAITAIYGFVGISISSLLSAGGTAYFAAATHPVGVLALIVSTCFALASLIRFIFQPNSLRIGPAGINLGFKIGKWRLFTRRASWTGVTAVALAKPKGTTSPEKWHIELRVADAKPVKLKLDAFEDEVDRRRLVAAIERFAPQAAVDPELQEILMPAQKRSYTELWLQSLASPPKRERLSPLEEGHSLQEGRYISVKQLGVGGQGTAYLARPARSAGSLISSETASKMAEQVVLKEFILPVFVDRKVRMKALERFENEAQVLQRLNHDQIVKITDFFVEDHRAYLVLEHIDGSSLREIVEQKGKLEEEEALKLALQMCSILEYLHGLAPPLVHRDFTPDNLILHKDGTLKLIDFNVAQQREASTATSTVVGKHAYIPPEQFRGKPTPQSDLYAMGGTLHFLVTGQEPEPLTPCHPSLSEEKISGELDSIVCRLTQLDLKARYASVGDAATDLNRTICGGTLKLPGEEPMLAGNQPRPMPDKEAAQVE